MHYSPRNTMVRPARYHVHDEEDSSMDAFHQSDEERLELFGIWNFLLPDLLRFPPPDLRVAFASEEMRNVVRSLTLSSHALLGNAGLQGVLRAYV